MRKIYFDFYSFKRIIYRVFFVLLLFFISNIHYGQNNDLPNPTQHMETIPAGYFIIPMDTNLQNIVPAGQAPFNLKAYGLINSFLQNNIPVRWAIRSGKSLNQADFTALTEQVYPTVGPAAIRSFYAGPFIVPDTITLCDGTTQSIIEYFGNNVTVYRLKESISIDIRYKITIKPKIAVFINGGNQEIHASILNEAGIPNYVFLDATHIMDIFSCFTFTSEPHWDINTANPVVVNGVKDFALYGGNFLAQCEAIETYENLGYFMTDKGIKSKGNILSHQYHNADLAFMQIHGTLFEKQTGSVPSWTLNTGSTWKNTSYKMVSHKGTDTVRVVGNHLRQPGEIGGNAFFLGSHNYMGSANKPDLSDLQKVNGLRMYLNAVFIPAIDNNAWANAGSGGSVVCTGNVTLGCLPPGPTGSTFTWSPATGLSCTDCPNPIATPTVTTTYYLTVTGGNGCTAIDSCVVTTGTPLSITLNAPAPICNGDTSILNINVSSGTGPYEYNWISNPPGFTSTISNPTIKPTSNTSYSVTVTDANGCIATGTTSIAVNAITLTGIPLNETCSGSKNGAITTTISANATLPVSYIWSNKATTSSISGLPAGTYTVTVTDGAGCTTSQSFKISSNPLITISSSFTPEYCNKANGSIEVLASGGTPPLTYSWDNGITQNVSKLTNLTAGPYNVTVTDGKCPASVTITIPPIAGPTAQTTSSPARCELNNGGATVNPISGTPPYSYNWNSTPPQSTPNLVNVVAKTYIVTVTDSKGCTTTASVSISGSPAPVSAITNQVPANCGYSNGALSVNASSGALPYTYSWNTNPPQYDTTAQGIPNGTYIVTVTDNNGCTTTALGVVPMLPGPTAIVTVTPELCLQSNGSATVSVSGGIGIPYTYMWSNGQTTATASGLSSNPGMYTVVVSDGGCSATNTVTIGNIPGPHAEFIANPTLLTINDGPVFFKDESTGNDIQTWYWTLGDGGTSSVTEFSHLYPLVGVYPVVLTITDINGCKDTAVDTIRVKDIFTIYIPNCFTPTEDNINDWFFPAGINWDPDYFEMYIFDRWGNIMYEAFDQKNKYWNGTLNNEGTQDDQFIDVYVYLIRVKEIDGPKHQFIGRVTLLK